MIPHIGFSWAKRIVAREMTAAAAINKIVRILRTPQQGKSRVEMRRDFPESTRSPDRQLTSITLSSAAKILNSFFGQSQKTTVSLLHR